MTERRDPRYRVHLEVRYGRAVDFVQEYAENLSKGGLFIRGAQDHAPGQEVTVEIEIPGYGTFKIVAEVAHVLSAETAQALGRRPGAGLAVRRAPKHYRKALREYLLLLGQRRDCVVYAEDPDVLQALEEAGYHAMPMPDLPELAAVLGATQAPVLGVILSPASEDRYAPALFAANLADRMHQVSFLDELDDLLPTLDGRIPTP